jgi:hypothetical protein
VAVASPMARKAREDTPVGAVERLTSHKTKIHLRNQIILFALLTCSVALVRKRTIPTERQPLVGEVSANFCG